MDTESGRERERKWVWERAEIFMINDFTGQCRASALSPWGASGLSQCARRSKLTAPRWVISEHYLNVHTQLHILYLYIYIYIYVCCIYLFHSLSSTVLPFCPPVWAAWDLYMVFDFYCICHMFTMWWQVHGPVAWMTRGKGDSTLIWHDLAVRCKMTVARDKRTAMFISLSSLDLYWIDLIIVPSHHALFQVSLRFAVVTTFQEIHLLV